MIEATLLFLTLNLYAGAPMPEPALATQYDVGQLVVVKASKGSKGSKGSKSAGSKKKA